MKRIPVPGLVIALLACASSAWAQPDRGRVRIVNNTVVGDDGARLRGFSTNPDTAYPYGLTDRIMLGWRDTFHLNAIRCSCYIGPFNGATPTSTWANIPIPKLLPLLDIDVDKASQYGFYIIIDYHSEGTPDWTAWTAFWQAVAPRYANRTHVLYEMENEQAFSPQLSDASWQQSAYQFIRALAPNTHIVTNSLVVSGAPMLPLAQLQASGPNAIDYSNASFGYHYPFGWHVYQDASGYVLDLKSQFPVFCTEGADDVPGDPNGGNDGLAWHENHGISWLSLAGDPDGPPATTGPGWVCNWPQDPNTSDGTGPGNQGAPPPPPPPPSSGPLIGDPDYTQQSGGNGNPLSSPWSGVGPAKIGLDSFDGPAGGPCGYIYDTGSGAWSAIVQTGTLAANTTYTLSALLQTSSPFPGGVLGVQTPDGSTVVAQQGFGELDNYTQVSVTFNSGSATTLTIFAGLTGFSGQAAWIHAASWSLAVGSSAPAPSGANLIQDPNYTGQTGGNGNPLQSPWSGTGPAKSGLDSYDGPGGAPCGYIYDGGTGAWSAITQTVTVNPNTNYTLSALIQTSSPFPGGYLGAQISDGTLLAQQAFAELDNYTQVSVSFNSGSATSLTVFAGFTGYSGVASWIHVDNWSMVDPPGTGSSTSAASGLPSGAGAGGKGACGLTGLETILLLGLLALRRRRS